MRSLLVSFFKNARRRCDNPVFYIVLFGLLLAAGLRPYYTDGRLLLGGEGNFVLDYPTYLRNFYFTWNPTMMGTGLPNLAPMAFGANILFLSGVQSLTASVRLASFAMIFLLYFIPFSFMMAAARRLSLRPFASFLIAAFYVLNPFNFYFLNSLNPWNVSVLGLLPMVLWVCLRFLDRPRLLFLTYGCLTAVFSFGLTNYPLHIIFHGAALLSLATAMLVREEEWRWSLFVRRAGILFSGFFLFALWWLLPLCLTMSSAVSLYTESFAQGWLNTTVRGAFPIWPRLLLLSVLIPRDPSYDFFAFWYHLPWATLILLIPLMIVIHSVFFEKKEKREARVLLFLFSTVLVSLFLAKRNAFPFGFIYIILFKTVPFFSIFKTPVEKFGLLYTYLLTVSMALCVRSLWQRRGYRWAITGLALYVAYAALPLVTGYMIADYRTALGYMQRSYKEKAAYARVRQEINADAKDYRLLGLPGVGNYQVCLPTADGGYYTGIDPIQMNLNKPVVVAYNDVQLRRLFFENFGCRHYARLLGLFNVRRLLVNPDQHPWFGYVGTMHAAGDLEQLLDGIMPSRRIGPIILYDNTAAVVPHIYAVSAIREEVTP